MQKRDSWQWLSWLPPGNKTGGWKTQGGRDTYISCLPFYSFKVLLYVHVVPIKGLPSGSVVKNLPVEQKTWVQSLGRKDPLEINLKPSFLTWHLLKKLQQFAVASTLVQCPLPDPQGSPCSGPHLQYWSQVLFSLTHSAVKLFSSLFSEYFSYNSLCILSLPPSLHLFCKCFYGFLLNFPSKLHSLAFDYIICWASLVVQLVKNPPAMWETWVRSLDWEDPLEKGKATHSSILVWRIAWIV